MLNNSAFLDAFMARYNYPGEAVSTFTRLQKRAETDPVFGGKLEEIVNGYMYPAADGLSDALHGMTAMAKTFDENEYTMHFLFLLNCMPILKARYDEAGYSEELFYRMADDLRCKLLECIECKGVPGTFVADWNDGTLKMKRFGLGRFQYEVRWTRDDPEITLSDGTVLPAGCKKIGFHIPSSGIPLTDEVRHDSYHRAWEFFRDQFPDGKVVFGCSSWLLYPRHKEFLPEHSNILRFLDDFHIVDSYVSDSFHDDWRVFGRYAGQPFDKLPRDTSLRRAYADWLAAGNKAGSAYGVFVYDGKTFTK